MPWCLPYALQLLTRWVFQPSSSLQASGAQLCVPQRLPKVLFIDTERKFAAGRLVDMALALHNDLFGQPAKLTQLTQHIIVVQPASSEELVSQLQVPCVLGVTCCRAHSC